MPTNTPNLNLVKPLVTENYDIAKVTNENADIIDEAIHNLDLEKQDLPTVEKVTPIDTDMVILLDSADSNTPKKWSWLNIKASLKTYFDNIYQTILVSGTNIKTVNGETLLGSGNIIIEGGSGSGSSEWNTISATLTYASADSPTFVANTSVDLTSVISVGMKLKLTQTTVKYFIVTGITSTTITLYGGTDYTLANATITLPYFSSMKSPFGFPMNSDKWSVIVTDTTERSQVTSGTTVYNLGGVNITIPIGVWNVSYHVLAQIGLASDPAGDRFMIISLSTANNTIIDSNSVSLAGSPLKFTRVYIQKNMLFNLSSKTTYYLNSKDDLGAGNKIFNVNNLSTLVLKAVCAYL